MKILFNILLLAIFKLVYSTTCISSSSDCTQDCIDEGYISDSSTCRDPNQSECLAVGAANCDTKTRCLYFGYTKASNGDCQQPTDQQCAENSVGDGNLCATSDHICYIRGFSKSSDSNDCVADDTCKSVEQSCSSPLTKCLYLNYVPDSNGDCIDPTYQYCDTSSNSYACYKSDGFCISKGWQKDSSTSACQAPSQSYCTQTQEACQDNIGACAYVYGYIYDSNSKFCKEPTAQDCYSSPSQASYACFKSDSFCRVQGWVSNSQDSSCILDTDCLNQDKCQSTQTACQFSGYVLNLEGNACITPTSSDCINTTNNKYACALITNICSNSLGWVKDSNSFVCNPPTQSSCQGSSQCSDNENACVFHYGFIQNTNNLCDEPQPSDCLNLSFTNSCRSDSSFCRKQNFQKNNSNNTCELPTDCITGDMCTSGYTSCLYQGYIKSQSGNNCVEPNLSDCDDSTNLYACSQSNNKCVQQYGWIQNQNSGCQRPTSASCLGSSKCISNDLACVWLYGYFNDSSGNCAEPQPQNCLDTSNIYACRTSDSFCWKQNFQQNSPNYTCVLPSDCLTGDMCTTGYTSCLYQGYIKSSSGNSCVDPSLSDCDNSANSYACSQSTNKCVSQYRWIQTQNLGCQRPTSAACLGSSNCTSNDLACVWLYGYINDSSDKCAEPEPQNCLDTNNIYACRTSDSFCWKQNFLQNSPNYTCILPSDCLTGDMCTTGYTSCLYKGYIKSSSDNSCVDPSLSDCDNSTNFYACSQSTNKCVQQYGWVQTQNLGCERPTSASCQGSNKCDQNDSACVWLYGFINNSSGNCDIPQPQDCLDTNYIYACRTSDSSCRIQNFLQNSPNDTCILPSDCLSGDMCTTGFTSCLYKGYIKSSSDNTCVEPILSDCDNSTNLYACSQSTNKCVQMYGWIQTLNLGCERPTSTFCQGSNKCNQNDSACVWLYGFYNNSIGNCDTPKAQNCLDQSNIYACRTSDSFCRKQNFLQNSPDSTCILPSDCLTGDMCTTGYTSCLYQGYVKSTSGNNCLSPLSSDCYDQNNEYACAVASNICVSQYGYVKDSTNSYCTPPTSSSCLGASICNSNESVCVWLYGYVNNSNNFCGVPQASDCMNSSNIYACRDSSFSCRQQNFLSNNSACDIPSTCLTDSNMCTTGYTSCLYQGYIKSSSNDNCVSPVSADCENQTNTLACARPNNICIQQYGWIKDSINSYCNPPTQLQCSGSNNCSSNESACVWLFGFVFKASNLCSIPEPSDCVEVTNIYACRLASSICRQQHNFDISSPDFYCKLPTDCLTASDKCTPGFTSCTYQGYIKSASSNQCAEPTSSDCENQSNIYVCALQTNICIQRFGWVADSPNTYCIVPTSISCFQSSNCNSNESACVWLYGYVNISNKCEIPEPSNCVNSQNIYSCRLDTHFCRQQNFLKNSSNDTCILPSTCLTDPNMCTPGYNSCTYQGYVKSTSSDNCVEPLSSDCSLHSNAYACALPSNKCVNQYGWEKDSSEQFCNPPSQVSCSNSTNCTSNESACVWYYGFVIKSTNVCTEPNAADCVDLLNIYACRDQITFCKQQNFLKSQSNETCELPTTCTTDSGMCAIAYTSCTYQGFIKNSGNNDCRLPTSYDCQDINNKYACALQTNYCVIQFGWIKNSSTSNYYCDGPALNVCQGSSKCQNDGNSCSFLYGLINSSNICSTPNSYQCQYSAGMYGCRISTHYCRQLNFSQDSPNDNCIIPSNCAQAGAGLCAPSYQSCTIQGYVKSSSSNDCVVPTQQDCQNQSNLLACAQASNQCVQYGWIKDPNNYYCIPSTTTECLQSPSCTSNETACVYYYGYNFDQNGNCLQPSTAECLDSSKIYSCNSSNSYCRQIYFKKSSINGSCVLPTDCATSSVACSSSYTACLYQGYVKNSSNNSCKIPTPFDCNNTSNIYACAQSTNFCNVYGWVVASTQDLYCQPITKASCTNTGQNYCQYFQSSCQFLYGYVKSSSSNDCVIPTPYDCVDTNNLYACQNVNSFCQLQGWPKNSNASKYTCSIPSNCLNTSNCNAQQTACPYLGFVSSQTNAGDCVTPTDSDCLLQTNAYACGLTSNQCIQLGYVQSTTANQYFCTSPTQANCQSNNSCQPGLTACSYVYGFVNDLSVNQCIQPTDADCANPTNIFACRLSAFACRQQNWQAVSATNFICVPPSDCLSGNQCTSSFTACQYYGYVKSSSGNNCIVPQDSDCFNTSNKYLCRSDVKFCTNKGWILQTTVSNSFYCEAPSFCLNEPYCGNGYTACQYIGYISSTNNICLVPGDYDCADAITNPFLCRSDITFCTNKGYIKSSTNNSCQVPTSCTGANDCASGKSACQFALGLIKNSSNNTCVAPDIQTCYDNTNTYICKVGNTYCTNIGFIKNSTNDTCVLPTNCTVNNQCASSLLVCIYYFGYIKSTSSNQCVQPTVSDCINTSNLYVCKSGNPFCTDMGYVLDSATAGQCKVPTNCTTGQQCGSNLASQACLYNGYIPTSNSNFQCQIPQYDDCKNPSNTELCRSGIYQQNCLNIGFVKASSGNYCVFPANCLTGFQCGTTRQVCYKLGYVKNSTNNKCVAPTNYDCSNTTVNLYQCSDDSFPSLCKSFGWVKDSINEYCVAPSTCGIGSDCGPSMSVCQFVYGYAPDPLTNQCIVPQDSDCINTNNLYLCKSGNQYCISIGYQKSSSNDTCAAPTKANCLVGPNCSYGITACQYTQGLIKNSIDDTCVVPSEADCDNFNRNLFACRLSTFECQQKGWQKSTQANQYFCQYNNQQDCLTLSNQCSSTATVCQYKFGYISGSSNQCFVPTDSNCIDQNNVFACIPNSFCIQKGWIASSNTNFTCKSPNCLQGQWCSIQFTACTSQGFVKSQIDDSCQYPQDYDCAASSTTGLQLCAPSSTFCTSRGWIKNPNNNTCLPPADCLAGFLCAPNLSACKYQGYIQSIHDYSCTTPSDADCMDNTQPLCRPGLPVNICGQKGYTQVQNRPTDYFCVLPNCLDQQNPQCGGSLTACLFGGFLKSPTDDTCIIPTDDDCINPNNQKLCRKGNIPCPSRGWQRDTSDPTLNQCTVPDNCLSQRYRCSSSLTACTLLGFLKSNSSDSCIEPTDEQCLDQAKQLCSFPESPCSLKGYIPGQNSKSCQTPTNCLGQKMCAPDMTACQLLGFINDKSNPNTCKVPSAADCSDSSQNNCNPAIVTKYCINMGFVKSDNGLFCEFPKNCLTGKQCAVNYAACKLLGYLQDPSKSDGICVETTIESCLNSSDSNMCVSTSICVTQFGLIPKSVSDFSCVAPSIQDCTNKKICQNQASYCVSNYGFTFESDKFSCIIPKCQELKVQCPKLCIQQGFVNNSSSICSYPSKCDQVGQKNCGTDKVACTQLGYSKSSTSDDCVCFQTIDSTGKCILDQQNASSNNTSNKQNLSFYLQIFLIIILIQVTV